MPRRQCDNRHKEVGLRIRVARLQAGLSQRELGAKVGVSYQQINKYERGENASTAVGLRDMASALAVSIDWLLGDEGAPVGTLSLNGVRLELRMAAAFAALANDKLRLAAINVVEALAPANTNIAAEGFPEAKQEMETAMIDPIAGAAEWPNHFGAARRD